MAVGTVRIPGRRARTVTAVTVIVLTAVGSLWGTDDLWPFAPFRMYASASRLDGRVLKAEFVGQTATGHRFTVKPGWVGLRPAEVEGQLPLTRPRRLPPGLLEDLARSWNRTHNRQIVRFELHLKGHRLKGGRPVEPLDVLVETWEGAPR